MVTKRVKGKRAKTLMLCLLAACILSPVFLTAVKAQSSGVTVGYWPLDEIKSAVTA